MSNMLRPELFRGKKCYLLLSALGMPLLDAFPSRQLTDRWPACPFIYGTRHAAKPHARLTVYALKH